MKHIIILIMCSGTNSLLFMILLTVSLNFAGCAVDSVIETSYFDEFLSDAPIATAVWGSNTILYFCIYFLIIDSTSSVCILYEQNVCLILSKISILRVYFPSLFKNYFQKIIGFEPSKKCTDILKELNNDKFSCYQYFVGNKNMNVTGKESDAGYSFYYDIETLLW